MTETAAIYGRAPASVPQTSSFQHGFFTLASLAQYAFTGVSLVGRCVTRSGIDASTAPYPQTTPLDHAPSLQIPEVTMGA